MQAAGTCAGNNFRSGGTGRNKRDLSSTRVLFVKSSFQRSLQRLAIPLEVLDIFEITESNLKTLGLLQRQIVKK